MPVGAAGEPVDLSGLLTAMLEAGERRNAQARFSGGLGINPKPRPWKAGVNDSDTISDRSRRKQCPPTSPAELLT